jgi:hypothetical protein
LHPPRLWWLDLKKTQIPDSDSGTSYFTALPLYRDTNFAWAFVARPQGPQTGLLMRARIACTPAWPAAIVKAFMVVGFGLGAVVQAGGMLNGIRRRA